MKGTCSIHKIKKKIKRMYKKLQGQKFYGTM